MLLTEKEVWTAAFVAAIEGLVATTVHNVLTSAEVASGAVSVADAALAEYRKKSFDPAGNLLQ